MTTESTATPLQACRNCGGGAPVDVHFCPQCSHLLALGRHGNYFGFMGLPRKLRLDAADLERRFRALSRQFHPDFFYNATPAERRASLERSSYLNDAYRTLRDLMPRIEYLLGLEGYAPKGPEEASRQVPPALLEEVFELNEQLDDIRAMKMRGAPADDWRTALEHARRPIDAKRLEHEAQLEALAGRWDALVDDGGGADERRRVLEALRARVLERNYISNLLGGIERELSA